MQNKLCNFATKCPVCKPQTVAQFWSACKDQLFYSNLVWAAGFLLQAYTNHLAQAFWSMGNSSQNDFKVPDSISNQKAELHLGNLDNLVS